MNIDVCNDDFGAMLNCAIRYTCGRRTYMPSIVVGVITPMLPEVNNRTLLCFIRDITDTPCWGDPCDEETWQRFLATCEAEWKRRGNDESSSIDLDAIGSVAGLG